MTDRSRSKRVGLVNGKISRRSADLLAKDLYCLGREVTLKTKTSRGRAAAMA
jgi:hypothetical protein